MDSVHVHICDFYRLRGDRIAYNWMMIDVVDLLRQAPRAGEQAEVRRAGRGYARNSRRGGGLVL